MSAPYVLVALGSLDRPMDTSEKGIKKARKNLVEVLKKASKLTERSGIQLLLEPQCRFEGFYGVNSTMSQTLSIVEEVDAENIVLMIDTFHSNIEETSIPKAMERRGSCSRTSTSPTATGSAPASAPSTSSPSSASCRIWTTTATSAWSAPPLDQTRTACASRA